MCGLGKLLNLLEPISLSYNEENIDKGIQLMDEKPPEQYLIEIVTAPTLFPTFLFLMVN